MLPILKDWEEIEAGQLVGIGEDADAVDAARETAERLSRTNCLFVLGTKDEIPWRDSYFDVAYIKGAASEEVRRVLKEEGKVVEWQSES